ncbi:Phosphoenolpyruvate synthase [Myxococcaceae bacterium]|nr:Phosphoenolpyruvate synthase [Myxococcaceae bacterium]
MKPAAWALVACVLLAAPAPAERRASAIRPGSDELPLRDRIEAIKTAPRGPFKHLRHWCNDGSVLPPSESCDPRGGGLEYGEWTDEVKALRSSGYEIANVYAIVKPERFTGTSADLRALQQMVVERCLIALDDGWVMRATKSYRGSVQAEDEGQGMARLVAALLDDPDWRDDARYFPLREVIRALPSSPDAGEGAASAADVRQRALVLGDADPPFFPIRVKIHGVPDAGDAAAVRAFARSQGRRDLAADYEELARRIDALYGPSPAPDRMRTLASRLPRGEFAEEIERGASTLERAPDAATRFAESSRWLARLRKETPSLRDRAAAIALFEASLALEETAYASGNDLLAASAGASRRLRLEWIAQAADALAGSGLLNLRHAETARGVVERLASEDPTLDRYRAELRTLARGPEWANGTLSFHFDEGVASLAELDPLALRCPQDRLRASPLLVYTTLVDGLVRDANAQAGIEHELFGKKLGAGLRALNPGLARGTLRVPRGKLDSRFYDPNGIYLLPETTSELPPVAGILTLGEGSSLSHVQLLARNLGIPNVVVGREFADEIRARNGKPVVLAVSPEGVVQLSAGGPRAEAVVAKAPEKPSEARLSPDLARLDLAATDFVPLSELRASDQGRLAGPKSANLGELRHAFGAQVPDGVVIPFGAFRKLLDRPIEPSGPPVFEWLREQYASLAKLPPAKRKKAVTRTLARMRDWVARVDPGDDFRRQLRESLERLAPGGGGVFVRSDTNVEDLAGFTGAGLNLTVPNVVGEAAVMEAIREVWASPFTERSYAWRQSLMDRPEYVFPAVLLQEAFAAERSGVMVSKDLETGQDGYVTIATNEGVGGAVDGQSAESLVAGLAGRDVRYLAQALEKTKKVLLPGGGVGTEPTRGTDTVLQPVEVAQLLAVAEAAPERFALLRGDDGVVRPADVEFGVRGHRVTLLQIRPFNESRGALESETLRSLDARAAGSSSVRVSLDAPPRE